MSICRYCRAPLSRTLINLGMQPLANSYLKAEDLARPEPRYPLHAKVCDRCFLVQVDHDILPEAIFSSYSYFSSYSTSWVEHGRRYADVMLTRFALGPNSLVVEVASNDGYLLQHFKRAGVPVLGIEPAGNVAAAAEQRGVPTEVAFFNLATAQRLTERGIKADLMTANNVLAHVPNLNDFVAGFQVLLAPEGVATFEFPHLLNLLRDGQFDTIYHEHYSYLSLHTAEQVFASHGLRVFDVAELPTHGGSLRLFACIAAAQHRDGAGLARVRAKEAAAGIDRIATYQGLAAKAEGVRNDLVGFLATCRLRGQRVAAYGAAAKGNTLLNFCAVGPDLIAVVFDKSPHKQGCFLPGSHIPVRGPEEIGRIRPDFLLILPWNLAEEIIAEQAQIRSWGGQFVTAIPKLSIR